MSGLLPGQAEAWPHGILDDGCEDDQGFITEWVFPFSDDTATVAAVDHAEAQLHDLLGTTTERDRQAFMAGIVTLTAWIQSDVTIAINAGKAYAQLDGLLTAVETRTVGLVSLVWSVGDEPRVDMSGFEDSIA